MRGARQVGKTWAITQLGKEHFRGRLHVIDLERRRDLHRIFEGDLSATRLLSQVEIFLDSRIVPGEDLLFLDEIQACPRALVAMRYFYEELPALHVVAAGSLVEFALRDLSFPVGRLQSLRVFPMTLLEFLWAAGHEKAAGVVEGPPRRQPDAVHDRLLDHVREYMFVGGLPEAVRAYAETRRLKDAFEIQRDVLTTYRDDFGKYAPRANKDCLGQVLVSVARSVGSQVKYTSLADGPTQPTIKNAFNLLRQALVVHRVPAVKHVGLPLGASASSRRFKAILLDVGLMQRLTGMPIDVEYARRDLLSIYQGALAEQFVGQELSASTGGDLHYWAREAKSSTAEVDYLIAPEGHVRPVEVKSGPSGRLKSLHLLLEEHPECAPGYVVSGSPYADLPEQKLVFVPLYSASWLGTAARPVPLADRDSP